MEHDAKLVDLQMLAEFVSEFLVRKQLGFNSAYLLQDTAKDD